MGLRRRRRYQAIEPDEILLDAQNLPGFDANRLEGRIERPFEHATFRNFLLAVFAIGVVFSLQLAKLQVIDAETLKARADANHLSQSVLIAERGLITDRFGEPLAQNEWHQEFGFATRAYPLGEAAAHVIGYVSYPKRDQNGFWFQDTTEGLAGIESSFDETLRGNNGVEIREISATGEQVSGSVVRAPNSGEHIALSLDAPLQQALYDALKTRTIESGFVGGSGVIMDVETGEIYALASYPSYDPGVVSEGGSDGRIAEYVTNPQSPFLDRAISGLYTPGSVVKPFMALAALSEDVITPEKQILSTGSISIPNPYNPALPSVFRDWKAHGWVDMRHAIAVSSDVYFYAIGGGFEDQKGLGIAAIEEYMRRFGFAQTTTIPLEGEASGVIPNPEWKSATFDGEQWFLGNTYHTSIGQYGFQVTPIQLARATASIANGGSLVQPSIIKGERGVRVPLGFSPDDIQVIQEGMRLAVTEGTALALSNTGVKAAGKTGTAEVGAKKEFINSDIIGFFPYDNPRFAFVVVMERAKAGTALGAPAAMQQVLQWIAANRPEMTE